MRRREFLGGVLGPWMLMLGMAGATLADTPERLTGEEIKALITGQAIEGTWSGAEYHQSFGADGRTTYTPVRGSPDVGKWRVNLEEGLYESWWERSGWSGYAIARKGAGFVWLDSRGEMHPFHVIKR